MDYHVERNQVCAPLRIKFDSSYSCFFQTFCWTSRANKQNINCVKQNEKKEDIIFR